MGTFGAAGSAIASGWFPDPTGRHEARFWDGAAWTDHIADGGVTGVDPQTTAPRATPGGAGGEPERPGKLSLLTQRAEKHPSDLTCRLTITQVTSLVIFTRRSTRGFVGTVPELRRCYNRVLLHNLVLGWWGFPLGFIWTVCALVRNARTLRRLEALGSTPGATLNLTP